MISLLTAGVPWEIIKDMDRVERMAWCIAVGEHNGGQFDFKSWSWKEQNR